MAALTTAAARTPGRMMFFRLRGELFAHNTLEGLSAKYEAARDASGEGASTFPVGMVRDRAFDGNLVAVISYNGRVWTDLDGDLLFDPREIEREAAAEADRQAFADASIAGECRVVA